MRRKNCKLNTQYRMCSSRLFNWRVTIKKFISGGQQLFKLILWDLDEKCIFFFLYYLDEI